MHVLYELLRIPMSRDRVFMTNKPVDTVGWENSILSITAFEITLFTKYYGLFGVVLIYRC
jgi:hypothetical protein